MFVFFSNFHVFQEKVPYDIDHVMKVGLTIIDTVILIKIIMSSSSLLNIIIFI